jgi:hypothetical protein
MATDTPSTFQKEHTNWPMPVAGGIAALDAPLDRLCSGGRQYETHDLRGSRSRWRSFGCDNLSDDYGIHCFLSPCLLES